MHYIGYIIFILPCRKRNNNFYYYPQVTKAAALRDSLHDSCLLLLLILLFAFFLLFSQVFLHRKQIRLNRTCPLSHLFRRRKQIWNHDRFQAGIGSGTDSVIRILHAIRLLRICPKRSTRLLIDFSIRFAVYDLIPAYDDLKIFRKSCLLQILFYNRACC